MILHANLYICLILFLYFPWSYISCAKIKMVEEPFSMSSPPGLSRNEDSILARYHPERASGPPYLIDNLNGRCFSFIANNYKYEFCPFKNVTQREQTYRWNSFNGLLGLWKHWIITGNKFTFMHMVHGDVCAGNLERETKVNFTCGTENAIVSVCEPSMCKYEMTFKTPYACPKDVFLVYPILTEKGKKRWREIEEDYAINVTTKQGYEKSRHKLFIDERLFVKDDLSKMVGNVDRRESTIELPSTTPQKNHNSAFEDNYNRFATKEQCSFEYSKLLDELEMLRNQLANITLRNMESMLTLERTTSVPIDLRLMAKNDMHRVENKGDLGYVRKNDTRDLRMDKSSIATKMNSSRGTGKINIEVMNERQYVKKFKSGRRGDDGVLDEKSYPMRNLLGRLEYDANVKTRLKVHSRIRDQERNGRRN